MESSAINLAMRILLARPFVRIFVNWWHRLGSNRDLAFMKLVNPSVATPTQAIIDEFGAYKKSTKGLTQRGEQWRRDMTGRFLRQLRMNLTDNQTLVG